MLLSDEDIRGALATGDLAISPLEPALVQPSSVDLRLGRYFRVLRPSAVLPPGTVIDPRIDQHHLFDARAPRRGEPLTLLPGEFALATTYETVHVSTALAARVEGKSSLGRLGYRVHSTAGFIDPGFNGKVTLELSNDTRLPQLWWPGMPVGQLCVFTLSSRAVMPYGSHGLGSKYQGQAGPQPSLAHTTWRDWSAELYAHG